MRDLALRPNFWLDAALHFALSKTQQDLAAANKKLGSLQEKNLHLEAQNSQLKQEKVTAATEAQSQQAPFIDYLQAQAAKWEHKYNAANESLVQTQKQCEQLKGEVKESAINLNAQAQAPNPSVNHQAQTPNRSAKPKRQAQAPSCYKVVFGMCFSFRPCISIRGKCWTNTLSLLKVFVCFEYISRPLKNPIAP